MNSKNVMVKISKILRCESSISPLKNVRMFADASEWRKARPYDEIPELTPFSILGKSGFPFLGAFNIENTHNTLMKIHQEFGECVKAPKIVENIIAISNPVDMEKVYKHSIDRNFVKSINYYKYDMKKDIFKDHRGILDVTLEDWHKFQVKMKNRISFSEIAYDNISVIEKIAVDFVKKLEELTNKNDETPEIFFIELKKLTIRFYLAVLLDNDFSKPSNSHIKSSEVERILEGLSAVQNGLGVGDYFHAFWSLLSAQDWKRTVRALDDILSIIEKYANKIEGNPTKTDNFSMLQKYFSNYKDDNILPKILAFDFALIGPNSVSSIISILLYRISLCQDVQDTLYNEIKSQLSDENALLTKEKLENMHYLTACVKEILRICPITIFSSRRIMKDMVLCGYQVPKGTIVMLSQYYTSNCTKYFSSSSKFKPERWLKGNCIDIHKCASIPYGYGERMCPAMEMSDLQIKIFICKIIQKYKISYDREELQIITRPPFELKGPLIFKLKKRNC